jgi:hypothetical protein
MNLGGWIVMTLSVGSVVATLVYCLYRVLTLPPVEVTEHLKGPFEVDTRDMVDAD